MLAWRTGSELRWFAGGGWLGCLAPLLNSFYDTGTRRLSGLRSALQIVACASWCASWCGRTSVCKHLRCLLCWARYCLEWRWSCFGTHRRLLSSALPVVLLHVPFPGTSL
jgi:hypothetical protein